MAHYVQLGERLLSPILTVPEDREAWMHWVAGGPPRMIAYGVACVKAIEYLGLSCLHLESAGRVDDALARADLCARVVRAKPGCIHPVSDRLAASYPPAIAAMTRFGHRHAASVLVRKTMKWVCDR